MDLVLQLCFIKPYLPETQSMGHETQVTQSHRVYGTAGGGCLAASRVTTLLLSSLTHVLEKS